MLTMRRRTTVQVAVLLSGVIAFLLSGCGGSVTDPIDERPEDKGPPGPPIPPPGPHFTVSPVPVSTIARITPLGYNNNVFPTPHTYWTTCDFDYILQADRPCHRELQPIVAPGDGRVRDILPGPDGAVVVEGPPGLVWTLGHVTPASIAVGDSVVAGQHIATMFYDHGFDLGLWNNGVEHDFIDSERYPSPARHAEHPIAQFPEPLRSELTTRIRMMEGPALGRVNYDVEGTAAGGWIIEGAPPGDVPFHGQNEHMLLFMGRYTERQSTRIVGIGQPWPEMFDWDGLAVGAATCDAGDPDSLQQVDCPDVAAAASEGVKVILAVDPAAPNWEEITPATGIVGMRLWNIDREARPNLDYPFGSLLVEMVNANTIRIEWFDTHGELTGFTPAARLYER